MIPVVEKLQGPDGDDAYWWALALGTCFGGNAANVAASGMPPVPASRSGSSCT
jgi:Na+/H+ antiporter NhaD/arsenite permease-like protein